MRWEGKCQSFQDRVVCVIFVMALKFGSARVNNLTPAFAVPHALPSFSKFLEEGIFPA